MSNRQLLDYLFSTNRLHLNRATLFDTPPPPLPEKIDPDKVEGMLLGLAVGDALGMTTEGPGWSVEKRSKLFPKGVSDYFNRFGNPNSVEGRGKPSDDTQMSFWTLESMLEESAFQPEKVAKLFVEREMEIVGRGGTVTEFVRHAQEDATLWYDWAQSGATTQGPVGLGNGAVMRIAPLVLPHLKTRSSELWVDTALAARITHNSSVSTAACMGFVHLLWQCLGMTSAPDPSWWVEEFATVVEPLECHAYPPRRALGIGAGERKLAKFVKIFLPKAMEKGISLRDAASPSGWASSSFVLETMPSFLYALMRHGRSFEEGVLRAVNDTHDNDTIGAMTGAMLGALYGLKAIPERWVRNLLGRTRKDDDGQVFRLAEMARAFAP